MILTVRNRARAAYDVTFRDNIVIVVDRNEGRKSVTNDAENVIADLRKLYDLTACQAVIYRDSRGIWDRLLIDDQGRFAGFSALNEPTLEAAIARVASLPPA
jgi:hypothetical protein